MLPVWQGEAAAPEPARLAELEAEIEEHRRALYFAHIDGVLVTPELLARTQLHMWLQDEAADLRQLERTRARVAETRAAWQAAQVAP